MEDYAVDEPAQGRWVVEGAEAGARNSQLSEGITAGRAEGQRKALLVASKAFARH